MGNTVPLPISLKLYVILVIPTENVKVNERYEMTSVQDSN